VQHLAWLQATPERKSGEKPQSRWQILEERGSDLVKLPEIETDSHILEWLLELGIFQSSGYGPTPLPYTEIESWSRMTGTIPTWEESRFLKMLSKEYCSQYNRSSDRDAPPPYTTEEVDQKSVSNRVLSALRMHSRYRKED